MGKSANRIGILGGTFDPVHNGHLALARAALNQLKLQRVYFVLAPRSPFKLTHRLSRLSDRLAMLRLALRGKKKFFVANWELARRGPSYTYLTLQAYKRRRPQDRLFLILGSDAWNGFKRWKKADLIRNLAEPVTARRPGAAVKSVRGAVLLRGKFPTISSTRVRRDAANGTMLFPRLPKQVERYIVRKKLYQ